MFFPSLSCNEQVSLVRGYQQGAVCPRNALGVGWLLFAHAVNSFWVSMLPTSPLVPGPFQRGNAANRWITGSPQPSGSIPLEVSLLSPDSASRSRPRTQAQQSSFHHAEFLPWWIVYCSCQRDQPHCLRSPLQDVHLCQSPLHRRRLRRCWLRVAFRQGQRGPSGSLARRLCYCWCLTWQYRWTGRNACHSVGVATVCG